MAWHCVAKIKNDLNEFTFANFPLEQYNGPQGGTSATDIGWSHYREQNRPGGHADFMRASAIADDLATQIDIPRLEVGSSYVKMVFGTLGGSAIDLRYVQEAHSGTQYSVDIQPYVYRNMYGTRMLVASSSYDTSKDTNMTWTWGLAINEETEEIYLMVIRAWIRWYYAIGSPSYYDRASAVAVVLDNNTAYNLWDMFKDSIPSGGGTNPYAGGGTSEPGGGEDQNFDEVSDTIDLPALPIYGATGSGFVTAFCPTIGQINSVADYLITPNVAQVIQGLFVKLSDVIIGLHLLPFVVDATNKKNIEIKNLAFTINTGVESYYADNQYQRIPMGSVDVLKCWDNCLDYNPYTFVSIYLPFCGYFELDTDEVMGKTLTVVYDVDIITGSCVALIQVDGSVMYQFSGMCSCQIPITSVDFNQAVQSLIGLGASAAAGIKMIKGAAAATEEAASVAMAPAKRNSVRQAAYENYMEAKMNEQEIKEGVASRLANASVNAVISGKGNYMHAGAVSSAPGFLACRKPFLIIKRPKQSVPEDYESMRGFPSNMKATLGDLSGYTEVEDIHLNIPDATVDEIVECERLLKGGVYL